MEYDIEICLYWAGFFPRVFYGGFTQKKTGGFFWVRTRVSEPWEKARSTTLDDENTSQHATFVLVTALGNQPEAFALDLGDDQSR